MVNYGERLDRTFAALVDPTRRAILARLEREDGASVSALAQPNSPAFGVAVNNIPLSSFGFVLFDHGTFKDKGFNDNDPTTLNSPVETWLRSEATAVLINRYNGTLVKGD